MPPGGKSRSVAGMRASAEETLAGSRGAYRPGSAYDEAFSQDGSPRPLYATLIDGLDGADLAGVAGGIAEHLHGREVTFGAEPAREFRIDAVPRLLDGKEWGGLERGLAQRARALAAFVSDVYGDQEIVAAGHVPARVVESAAYYEPWVRGIEVPRQGYVLGPDLVRNADGVLRVLEDNIRTPSGLAYLLAARTALDAQLPVVAPAVRRETSQVLAWLVETLRAAAPAAIDDPRVAIVSDGPSNSAWYEHRELARATGLALFRPADLLVRGGRLHGRVDGGGAEPIDVVYRRTDEDRLRDHSGRPTWLAELLLPPVRRGALSVVNPLGAGVADDKLAHAYVEEMVRFYLDEEPLLESVPTYDLGDGEVRDAVLPRLGELVVKPRGGLGGDGLVVCPHASEQDRELIERRVVEDPEAWVAQELVAISTHPTVCGGRLEPRHVDLRPFVIGGGSGARVVPGGLTRVAFGAGSLVVNSSQNGGAKDTWVLA